MEFVRKPLRAIFMRIEGGFDAIFGPSWNPMYCLGALGFFYFWVVSATGIYLYIFFDTGIPAAYESVEYLTNEQWWLGGIMRSLHRYASDALVAMIAVHVVREFAFDRYRGGRAFSWLTGIPTIWMLMGAGITGYWLVWDRLAQYVAESSTEFLDWLPIFGAPIARNFMSPEHLDGRFFTLLVFLHIAVPLIMLFIMWTHLQRVSYARMNPARGLAVGSFLMLLVLSLVVPAESQGIADLNQVPSPIALDWFYLWVFPLSDLWGAGTVWALAIGGTVVLLALPWLPPKKTGNVAVVDLDNCNGCQRCEADCPFGAITMIPRTDGKPFEQEAFVNPNKCTSCGICAGACPTSTPFRRRGPLLPGIDLPEPGLAKVRDWVHAAAATLSGPGRVIVFGCDYALDVKDLPENAAGVSLECTGMLPPSFIDYVLSQDLADGVVVTGCRSGECRYRLGHRWTDERLDGERDPKLRDRVPRERVTRLWAASTERRRFVRDLQAFQDSLRPGDRTTPPGSGAGNREAAE